MGARLGQHFLADKATLDGIVSAIEPHDGDFLYEIGPGHGELSDRILAANEGIHLVMIEKDEKLAEALRKKFEKNPRVSLVKGDALETLSEVIEKNIQAHPTFKIVGNIPYYITGHLFTKISELKEKPSRCVFMIQKEVAERIAAQPPEMNRFAASVQFWAHPKIVMTVPKRHFTPPPEVDSAVILLELRQKAVFPDSVAYYSTVRMLFAQPRKTIGNNLRAPKAASLKKTGHDGAPGEHFESLGINLQARPQNLSIQEIAKIAEHLNF